MSDLFTNLARAASGVPPQVWPQLAARFGTPPPLSGDDLPVAHVAAGLPELALPPLVPPDDTRLGQPLATLRQMRLAAPTDLAHDDGVQPVRADDAGGRADRPMATDDQLTPVELTARDPAAVSANSEPEPAGIAHRMPPTPAIPAPLPQSIAPAVADAPHPHTSLPARLSGAPSTQAAPPEVTTAPDAMVMRAALIAPARHTEDELASQIVSAPPPEAVSAPTRAPARPNSASQLPIAATEAVNATAHETPITPIYDPAAALMPAALKESEMPLAPAHATLDSQTGVPAPSSTAPQTPATRSTLSGAAAQRLAAVPDAAIAPTLESAPTPAPATPVAPIYAEASASTHVAPRGPGMPLTVTPATPQIQISTPAPEAAVAPAWSSTAPHITAGAPIPDMPIAPTSPGLAIPAVDRPARSHTAPPTYAAGQATPVAPIHNPDTARAPEAPVVPSIAASQAPATHSTSASATAQRSAAMPARETPVVPALEVPIAPTPPNAIAQRSAAASARETSVPPAPSQAPVQFGEKGGSVGILNAPAGAVKNLLFENERSFAAAQDDMLERDSRYLAPASDSAPPNVASQSHSAMHDAASAPMRREAAAAPAPEVLVVPAPLRLAPQTHAALPTPEPAATPAQSPASPSDVARPQAVAPAPASLAPQTPARHSAPPSAIQQRSAAAPTSEVPVRPADVSALPIITPQNPPIRSAPSSAAPQLLAVPLPEAPRASRDAMAMSAPSSVSSAARAGSAGSAQPGVAAGAQPALAREPLIEPAARALVHTPRPALPAATGDRADIRPAPAAQAQRGNSAPGRGERGEAPQDPPTIRVLIGRVEVRISDPPPAPPRRPARPSTGISLDAYLRGAPEDV